MPQLYTVKMVAIKKVSVYDAAGKLIAERVEEFPQTYSDLPWSTAQAYLHSFPDNKVEIIRQTPEPSRAAEPGRKMKHALRPAVVARAREEETVNPARDEDDFTNAAMSGDLAAAINAEMSER